MNTYKENKANARTYNTEPTKTDQSQARETDINVIVSRYGISGQVPAPQQEPMYGDFSNTPQDLREAIEVARGIEQHRSKLPPELAEMPIEQILALTNDELTNILTPPATKPEEKKETT